MLYTQVESEIGVGSAFTVSVPVAFAAADIEVVKATAEGTMPALPPASLLAPPSTPAAATIATTIDATNDSQRRHQIIFSEQRGEARGGRGRGRGGARPTTWTPERDLQQKKQQEHDSHSHCSLSPLLDSECFSSTPQAWDKRSAEVAEAAAPSVAGHTNAGLSTETAISLLKVAGPSEAAGDVGTEPLSSLYNQSVEIHTSTSLVPKNVPAMDAGISDGDGDVSIIGVQATGATRAGVCVDEALRPGYNGSYGGGYDASLLSRPSAPEGWVMKAGGAATKTSRRDNGDREREAEEIGNGAPFRFHILLAEDSIPNQKLMRRILEREGHTVQAVSLITCHAW